MKRKVKITDKVSGKVIIKEVNVRNYEHFEIQRRTKASIHKDKSKIIPRKQKYKKIEDGD